MVGARERRWEVTIVDKDSEDLEKDEIIHYEARVTASGEDEAKQRALALIRERVAQLSGRNLVITTVREIWKA
jgi:hypothetical protein